MDVDRIAKKLFQIFSGIGVDNLLANYLLSSLFGIASPKNSKHAITVNIASTSILTNCWVSDPLSV